MAETIFLRLAYCRRRLFFLVNNVIFGRKPFSSAGGLPQALFFFFFKNDVLGKNWVKKLSFLTFLAFLAQKQPFFTPLCSSPYRIVTNPYTRNIELCQLFFKPFVLYGRAIDFNFWAVLSVYDFDDSLFPKNRPPCFAAR